MGFMDEIFFLRNIQNTVKCARDQYIKACGADYFNIFVTVQENVIYPINKNCKMDRASGASAAPMVAETTPVAAGTTPMVAETGSKKHDGSDSAAWAAIPHPFEFFAILLFTVIKITQAF